MTIDIRQRAERMAVQAGTAATLSNCVGLQGVHLLENSGCKECPLYKDARSVVNGEGPLDAEIIFVGEGPGRIEDARRRPFVGESGQLLRGTPSRMGRQLFGGWLAAVGLDPDAVFLTNAVRHRPFKNRTPRPPEIEACNHWLNDELRALKNAKLIVALGGTALAALVGPTAGGITKMRGNMFHHAPTGLPVLATIHPAYVINRWEEEYTILRDLEKAVRILRGEEDAQALGDYSVIETVDQALALRAQMTTEWNMIHFDLETTGLDWANNEILCLGFTPEPGVSHILPIFGQHLSWLWNDEELQTIAEDVLRPIMGCEVPKAGQNLKFDMHFMERRRDHPAIHPDLVSVWGLPVANYTDDTMLAFHMVHEQRPHDLEHLRSIYTSMPMYEAGLSEWVPSKSKHSFANIPNEVLWEYQGGDTDCVARALPRIKEQFDTGPDFPSVEWVYNNITIPLTRPLMNMEKRGVLIDAKRLAATKKEWDKRITEGEARVRAGVPAAWQAKFEKALGGKKPFNPGSDDHMRALLFDHLRLSPPTEIRRSKGKDIKTVRKTGKTGKISLDSVSREIMMKQSPKAEIVRHLHEWKEWKHNRSSFLTGATGKTGVMSHIQADSRIHTSYRIDGAETGRISSSPNLQNIVKGVGIRELFVPPPDYTLLEIDYSTLELRVLAYIAQDELMLDLLEHGDLHLQTASLISGVPVEILEKDLKLKKHWRDRAKGANFGVAYGATAYRLAKDNGVSIETGQKWLDAIFAKYTKLPVYFTQCEREIKTQGYEENACGRRRHFWGVRSMRHTWSYEKNLRHQFREGYNFKVQSSGSDMLSLVTVKLDTDPWLEAHDVRMIMSVHDALFFEVPTAIIKEAARYLVDVFEEVPRELMGWHLPAEAKSGPSWGEVEDLDLGLAAA
jgi:DNA polymerase-1